MKDRLLRLAVIALLVASVFALLGYLLRTLARESARRHLLARVLDIDVEQWPESAEVCVAYEVPDWEWLNFDLVAALRISPEQYVELVRQLDLAGTEDKARLFSVWQSGLSTTPTWWTAKGETPANAVYGWVNGVMLSAKREGGIMYIVVDGLSTRERWPFRLWDPILSNQVDSACPALGDSVATDASAEGAKTQPPSQ